MNTVRPHIYLNVFRGFAALWVIMFHSSMQFIDGGGLKYFKNPIYAFSSFGSLGVPMFFVISGYCIFAAVHSNCLKSGTIKSFAHARIRRIFPPYLAVFALTLIVGFFAMLHNGSLGRLSKNINISDPLFWITNLTLSHVPFGQQACVAVSWSLSYEVTFYGIAAVMIFLSSRVVISRTPNDRIDKVSKMNFMLTVVSLIWLLIAPHVIFPMDRWYQFGLGGQMFFLIESIFNKKIKSIKSRRIELILTMLMVITFSFFTTQNTGVNGLFEGHILVHPHPTTREDAIVCLLTCIAIGLTFRKVPFEPTNVIYRIFSWLGNISYSLYLTHMIFLPFIIVMMVRIGFKNDLYWVTLLTCIFTTVGAATVFYKVIEEKFLNSKTRPQNLNSISNNG